MNKIEEGKDKFYMGEDEAKPIAEITFKHRDSKTIIADHTFVSEDLRGQGIAGKLFDRLIQYARENNKEIVPLCPYVKQKMEQSDELRLMIAK